MKGDFIGFSFDGIHCSELGITRVANGDRYDEELFPEISDRSSEIIGADGENYFGTEYRKKPFSINIAFDSITETQFRKIRKLFGTKKICELIFDERPYKVYSVKLESPIELNYICFDEHKKVLYSQLYPNEELPDGVRFIDSYDSDGEVHRILEKVDPWIYEYDSSGEPVTERIYKGEGTIELIAYTPFAKQLYKQLDIYRPENKEQYQVITTYDNVDEWAESSGLLSAAAFDEHNIDKTCAITETNDYNLEIPVYNPGDLDTGFYLYIPFTDETIQPNTGDYIKIFGDENGLLLNPITRKSKVETGIIINTVNHLIEGVIYEPVTERNDYREKTWQITHNIYNECIVAGDFPKIHCTDWLLDDEKYKQAIYLNCEAGVAENIQINYDYLYF